MKTSKGLIRAANRSGTASRKRAPAERQSGRLSEPTMCERCGAVLAQRVWRRDVPVTNAQLARAAWRICPACKQADEGVALGLIVLRGAYVLANLAAIRRRIANAAAQAEHTEPLRRVLSTERRGDEIEVRTTSQKLAHRLVHELKKAFGGRAQYKWSDDGSLFAVWTRA